MPPPTPETFWPLLQSHLRSHASWTTYLSAPDWTRFITSAAESICRDQLGLQTNREYFRLDLAAWSLRTPNSYDWDLRVAFEAENTCRWDDELCKLSHILADLRVLVAYNLHATRTCTDLLADYLAQQRDRVTRHPACRWLFVFGPRLPDDYWTAYTLSPEGHILPLPDASPLRGEEMRASATISN